MGLCIQADIETQDLQSKHDDISKGTTELSADLRPNIQPAEDVVQNEYHPSKFDEASSELTEFVEANYGTGFLKRLCFQLWGVD